LHRKTLTTNIQSLPTNLEQKEVSGADIFNTVVVLSRLYDKIKFDKEENKNAIANIIYNLMKVHGHKLEINVIINILHTLIDYKIPNIQELLKMSLKFIKKQLINLTPKDYQELSEINSKVQPNTLRQYMYKDLLQKLNLKISMDLDRNNLDFLISAFMHHKNDLKKLNLALDAVKDCKLENVSLNTILDLINAISYVPHLPNEYLSILNKVQLYLMERTNEIKTNDIIFLLHNLVYAIECNKYV
jgi:hypothetical protein